jgi:hypothetical protein
MLTAPGGCVQRTFYCCLRLFFIVGNGYIVTIFNSKINRPGRAVADRVDEPLRRVVRRVRAVPADLGFGRTVVSAIVDEQ